MSIHNSLSIIQYQYRYINKYRTQILASNQYGSNLFFILIKASASHSSQLKELKAKCCKLQGVVNNISLKCTFENPLKAVHHPKIFWHMFETH